MRNTLQDIDIKTKHSFFDDIINMNDFDQNEITIDERSYKNIVIHYIGYVMIKDSKYVKIFYTLLLTKWMDTLKKLIKVSIWH